MKSRLAKIAFFAAASLAVAAFVFSKKETEKTGLELPETVDFNWHVRPILSDRCFKCHGPDEQKRQAGLRLDDEKSAFSELPESPGLFVIVAGQPEKSELIRRIFSTDSAEVMPTPESHLSLSNFEKALLKKWVEQGAKWQKHWSLVQPKKVDLPADLPQKWSKNAIDAFVFEKMRTEKMEPSEPAEPSALARRLSFDLVGLPPDDALLKKMEAGEPLEKLADELLASPHFGEKWAVSWLDLARYSDTHGYQDDLHRVMWPWRDWVIKSLNENMPYDRFVTWQLAGDLVPEATKETILATGFCRNHKITQEGGVIEEEYRVEYVADRTATFGKALLGLTVECARCHDHKYDPISQAEFFGLSAFFNRVPERGFVPNLETPKPFLTITKSDATDGVLAFLNKNEAFLNEKDTVLAMVMQDSTEKGGRKAYILERGQYDQRRAEAPPTAPRAVLFFDETRFEKDRLGLSKWLFSNENPLTARVAVNRIWQEIFGRGLVETSDNFGMQGSLPSHPELLDWLAVEFVESGWDVKKMIRLIVSSEVYRQSSEASKSQIERDPANVFLARGPRFRMSYESIRDLALWASGLLVPEIGGPSCKPYQPPGIWEALSTEKSNDNARGEFVYRADTAARKLYRRSLYTYNRRTIPPPTSLAFDAPARDVCEVKRARTSTPLQALTMLNDPQILEAARVLAMRVLEHENLRKPSERVAAVFEKIMSRKGSKKEIAALVELFEAELFAFKKSPEKAEKLLKTGRFPQNPKLERAESAALMLVASAVFNLDGAMTKG